MRSRCFQGILGTDFVVLESYGNGGGFGIKVVVAWIPVWYELVGWKARNGSRSEQGKGIVHLLQEPVCVGLDGGRGQKEKKGRKEG